MSSVVDRALVRALAQGRGAGWLGALALGRAAIDEVLRLVVEDPRWDRQVESRASYYASVLLALDPDVDLGVILAALASHEPDEVGLASSVLGQLAWRGHAAALEAQVARVREGVEDEWCLEGGPQFVARVFALAGRALEPDTRSGTSWPRPQLDSEIALADLVELATRGEDPRRWMAARRLGELGHGDWIGEAETFLRSQCGLTLAERTRGQQRLAWMRYLEALPAALTLTHARAWFHAEWPLSLAADSILRRHAEPEDRPMLAVAGAKALAEGSMYRLCSIVEALDRIAAPQSIEFLCQVYCEVDYAYARARACEALAAHADRPEVRSLLVEALWDCEDGTRLLACEIVDPRANASRLQALERDEFEDADVRAAARAALG